MFSAKKPNVYPPRRRQRITLASVHNHMNQSPRSIRRGLDLSREQEPRTFDREIIPPQRFEPPPEQKPTPFPRPHRRVVPTRPPIDEVKTSYLSWILFSLIKFIKLVLRPFTRRIPTLSETTEEVTHTHLIVSKENYDVESIQRTHDVKEARNARIPDGKQDGYHVDHGHHNSGDQEVYYTSEDRVIPPQMDNNHLRTYDGHGDHAFNYSYEDYGYYTVREGVFHERPRVVSSSRQAEIAQLVNDLFPIDTNMSRVKSSPPIGEDEEKYEKTTSRTGAVLEESRERWTDEQWEKEISRIYREGLSIKAKEEGTLFREKREDKRKKLKKTKGRPVAGPEGLDEASSSTRVIKKPRVHIRQRLYTQLTEPVESKETVSSPNDDKWIFDEFMEGLEKERRRLEAHRKILELLRK